MHENCLPLCGHEWQSFEKKSGGRTCCFLLSFSLKTLCAFLWCRLTSLERERHLCDNILFKFLHTSLTHSLTRENYVCSIYLSMVLRAAIFGNVMLNESSKTIILFMGTGKWFLSSCPWKGSTTIRHLPFVHNWWSTMRCGKWTLSTLRRTTWRLKPAWFVVIAISFSSH